jgi:hypothetical protein
MSVELVSRAGWADKIRTAWQSSFNGIIECGRLLIAAKEKLEHGEFLQMIESELPFKARTGQRLMKIAQDERITNASNSTLLPPHLHTLYEISRLPDRAFEQKLSDGTIHPEMQRKDVARENRIISLLKAPRRLVGAKHPAETIHLPAVRAKHRGAPENPLGI